MCRFGATSFPQTTQCNIGQLLYMGVDLCAIHIKCARTAFMRQWWDNWIREKQTASLYVSGKAVNDLLTRLKLHADILTLRTIVCRHHQSENWTLMWQQTHTHKHSQKKREHRLERVPPTWRDSVTASGRPALTTSAAECQNCFLSSNKHRPNLERLLLAAEYDPAPLPPDETRQSETKSGLYV